MRRLGPVLFIILVTVSVFFFFRTFSNQQDLPDFAKEVLAAFFGSVITVAITVLLLRFQSASEVSRDKTVAVFQAKMRVYEGFCEALCGLAENGYVQGPQEQTLRLWAMRLNLVCGQEVSDAIDRFFLQTHRYGTLFLENLSAEQRADLVEWDAYLLKRSKSNKTPEQCFVSIGALVAHLKHDLGEADISKLKDIVSAQHAVDDILGANQPK
jgi:hypothetical protein